MKNVCSLSNQEVYVLLDELTKYDCGLIEKHRYIMSQGVSSQDAAEYLVNNSAALWAKVYLNWGARDYQLQILEQGKKSSQTVLRLGRRLGKTECMCVLILWHALTQINKGPNNQYDILIITPYETQIDLIFGRLQQLIDGAPILKNLIKRDIHHRLEFKNGSKIIGLTAGSKSGSGAANTRGD